MSPIVRRQVDQILADAELDPDVDDECDLEGWTWADTVYVVGALGLFSWPWLLLGYAAWVTRAW